MNNILVIDLVYLLYFLFSNKSNLYIEYKIENFLVVHYNDGRREGTHSMRGWLKGRVGNRLGGGGGRDINNYTCTGQNLQRWSGSKLQIF